MESAKRVLVCLTKENSLLQCAKFVQGITGQYSANNGDKAFIHCGLDRNQFVISDRQFPGSAPVQLQRPSFCPIKNLSPTQAAALPGEIRNRGVDVGVAVLVQSVNKKVLLTRRSKSLNIFPNVWVPPGGHVEPGEQLLEAGLRELREETGLRLQGVPWCMLGLWESAFPPLLSQGLPSRHHIVTYLLVQSNQTHQQLQERLCPDEREVSACVWLDTEIAKCIVAAEDDAKDSGKPQGPAPATIRVSELINGSLSQSDRSMATFLSTAPKEGEAVERISTGTKYALSLWLETLPKAPSREHE